MVMTHLSMLRSWIRIRLRKTELFYSKHLYVEPKKFEDMCEVYERSFFEAHSFHHTGSEEQMTRVVLACSSALTVADYFD